MKIAIVSSGYLPVPAIKGGAVEVLTQYIIDGFLDRGDFVDVYTKKDKDLQDYHKNMNLIQISYGKLEFFLYKCINYIFKILNIYIRMFPYQIKVAKKINKQDYDYIIIENNILLHKTIYTQYHKKHKDAKFICHLHNTYELKNDILRQKNYRYVSDTSNRILFVSEFLKKDFFKYYKNDKNAEVLYNCVDFDLFNKENVDLSLRSKLGLSNDDFVYIFMGRMGEDKGVYELIKAFNLLNKEIDNIKLVLVGNKDNSFEKIENEINLDNIIITGFVDSKNVAKYLNIADVAIFPSKWDEPFGVVALEAMATGKSIIATKSGGLIEILDDNCSILINKESSSQMIEDLYNSMKKLYFDEDFRNKCAKNAFEKVHNIKNFDKKYYFNNFWDKIVD